MRNLEAQYGLPRITLQCALRNLDPSMRLAINPCDAVRTSFGITPDGTLLRSAWAVNRVGAPLHPSWILGNVATMPLAAILDQASVQRMRERADENRGHCKVFAFLNGQESDPQDRFYERTDPL